MLPRLLLLCLGLGLFLVAGSALLPLLTVTTVVSVAAVSLTTVSVTTAAAPVAATASASATPRAVTALIALSIAVRTRLAEGASLSFLLSGLLRVVGSATRHVGRLVGVDVKTLIAEVDSIIVVVTTSPPGLLGLAALELPNLLNDEELVLRSLLTLWLASLNLLLFDLLAATHP